LSVYRAEWKWDGVRVQWVNEGGAVKIYTRTGEDLTAAFPDLCAPMPSSVAIDGELLIRTDDGQIRPFSQLQSRLNRKRATAALLAESPAHIRAYDILHADGQDLRSLEFDQRRVRLEAFLTQTKPPRFDLSPLLPFRDWASLEALRQAAPDHAEGLMLKRADSPYIGGRPKGHWFKWKRAPLEADAVLMYAQRGHGRRSSQFSDFTFGVWREGELVPIGKAYFGFSDAELKLLDKFVRDHTIDRFGPVRVIAHEPELGLVVTVHFDGIQRSKRHKSGLALRFPRIGRIRWDKLPKDADQLGTIEMLMVDHPS
jgi:DNA ligase-1